MKDYCFQDGETQHCIVCVCVNWICGLNGQSDTSTRCGAERRSDVHGTISTASSFQS